VRRILAQFTPSTIYAARLLIREAVRMIPANIAKLPELLSRHQTWGVR
jgi:hypothetical protein